MADSVNMWRSEWSNIRALESQLDEQRAAAAASQSRLSSKLNKLQGDLSDRVSRLSSSFDAFVGLSEIRDELAVHVDARRWRLAARQLIEAGLSPAPAPAGGGVEGLADVAGYWLPAVVKVLPDILESSGATGDVREALRRDHRRAATFVVCVAALLGAPAVADLYVAAAFDGDEPQLNNAHLAMWQAAGAALLSATARGIVDQSLARRVAALDPPAHEAVVARLALHPPDCPGAPTAAPTATPTATDQGLAAANLRRWSTWLADLPAGDNEAAGQTAQPDSVGVEPARQQLLGVVRSLVEEGSLPERTMLDRADSLRSVIDPTRAPPPADWDSDGGCVGERLVDDVLAGSASSAGSARLLSKLIGSAADQLLLRANAAPTASTSVKVVGGNITVTPGGAEPAEVAGAEVRIRARDAPAGRSARTVVAAGAAIGVLFVVLGVAVAPGWFAVTAVVAAVTAGWWWSLQRSTAAADTARQAEIDSLHEQIAHAAQQLVDEGGRVQVAQAEAANAHAAIRTTLGL